MWKNNNSDDLGALHILVSQETRVSNTMKNGYSCCQEYVRVSSFLETRIFRLIILLNALLSLYWSSLFSFYLSLKTTDLMSVLRSSHSLSPCCSLVYVNLRFMTRRSDMWWCIQNTQENNEFNPSWVMLEWDTEVNISFLYHQDSSLSFLWFSYQLLWHKQSNFLYEWHERSTTMYGADSSHHSEINKKMYIKRKQRVTYVSITRGPLVVVRFLRWNRQSTVEYRDFKVRVSHDPDMLSPDILNHELRSEEVAVEGFLPDMTSL